MDPAKLKGHGLRSSVDCTWGNLSVVLVLKDIVGEVSVMLDCQFLYDLEFNLMDGQARVVVVHRNIGPSCFVRKEDILLELGTDCSLALILAAPGGQMCCVSMS